MPENDNELRNILEVLKDIRDLVKLDMLQRAAKNVSTQHIMEPVELPAGEACRVCGIQLMENWGYVCTSAICPARVT